MEEMLNKLYECFCTTPPFEKEQEEIEWCHRQLIERLGKKERRLVLRIIDKKDTIAERLSYDCFAAGIRLGYQLSKMLQLESRE